MCLVLGNAPAYLYELCRPVSGLPGRRGIRSSVTGQLLVPRATTATRQRRALFGFATPRGRHYQGFQLPGAATPRVHHSQGAPLYSVSEHFTVVSISHNLQTYKTSRTWKIYSLSFNRSSIDKNKCVIK